MDKCIEDLRNLMLDIEEKKRKKEEIKKKALEHRDSYTSAEQVDEVLAEIKNLDDEINALEARKAELAKQNEQKQGEQRIMANDYIQLTQEREQRDQAIAKFKDTRSMTISAKEIRSVLLASEGIVTPTKVGGVEQPFSTTISIVDHVKVVDMTGAGAYKKPFIRQHAQASAKTDGTAQQTSSEPTFGSVTISPTTKAVTSYISTQFEKVTPINYYNEVKNSAQIALKVQLAQDIVAKIKTAVDDPADASDTAAPMYATLEASTKNGMLTGSSTVTGNINEKTLRNIVMSYGGDANVMGNAWLYLNKKDLIAFGDVRGTNEKRYVYEITPNAQNPNIGIIRDGGLAVPYCIVPSLTELAGTAQTSEPIQTMIYGSPLNFELALFGDMTIEVSKDYKFAEGLLTILGQATYGGNIVVPDGFVVVTIPAKTGS